MSFVKGIANPEVQKYSGEIIYVDNRASVTRVQTKKKTLKSYWNSKDYAGNNLNVSPYFDDFDKDKNFKKFYSNQALQQK